MFAKPTKFLRACASGLLLAAALSAPALAQTEDPGTSVTTIAGAFAGFVDGNNDVSQLNTPFGVAYDGTNNLYIADYGNNALRVLRVGTETVETLLPRPGQSNPLSRPVDVALDSSGRVYVINQNNGALIRYTPSSKVSERVGQLFTRPAAVDIDEAGTIYVAEEAGYIRVVNEPTPLYTWRPGGQRFSGLASLGNNRFAVSDAGLHVIWVFNGTTRPVAVAGLEGTPGFANGAMGVSRLNTPYHIAPSLDGGLVFADRLNHRVRYIDAQNVASTLFGLDPSEWVTLPGLFPGWADGPVDWAESREPVGIAVAPSGAIFDTEVYYHLVRRASGFLSTNVVVPPEALTALLSPSSGFFQNGVTVTITSTNGVEFGEEVRIHYTLDGSDPTETDSMVPIFNGVGVLQLAGPIDLEDLKVRIFNGGVAGPVVSGQPSATAPVSVLISPKSGFFPSGTDLVVTSASPGGFGPQVQLFYTDDNTDPTTGDNNIPIINGIGRVFLPGPVNLSNIRVRAFNNGVAGPVTSGVATPVPLPGISPSSGYFVTNTVVTITNTTGSSPTFPAGTELYYTLDGSEPNQSSTPIEIVNGIGRLPLTGPVNLVNLKVRAFLGGNAGATVSGEPTSFVPNRIGFGFPRPEEASSDFVASPGQRFYAPVAMLVQPGQLMYGLQFGLTVTNVGSAPAPAAGGYDMGFESFFVKPVEGGWSDIPPATFVNKTIEITNIIVGTNVVTFTNVTDFFSNLVVRTQSPAGTNLLGVGWLERASFTNLYNTREHDLIRYSLPHDNLFVSSSGKVVPGGFSFVVPGTAVAGDSYQIEIIRASANEDGVSKDVFIEMPRGNDTNIPITAVEQITVGQRRYIVGDMAPFRWFNAGDFGDGSILNNDMEQIHQTVIYGVNAPPPGSDFEDAIDSCCVDINGVDRSGSFQPWDGNDSAINEIAFGDGDLNIADLYVSFRRALDPSLNWYARYWENGERKAEVVDNTFRGQSTQTATSASSFSAEGFSAAVSDEPSAVRFHVGGVQASPGELAAVPIYASVEGAPIRTLLLNIKVQVADGPVGLAQPVSFVAHPLLGGPNFGGAGTTTGYGAAWIDPNHPGLSGEVQIGTLYVPIPENASANTAFLIRFEKVSASPNGIGILPATTQDGVVIMKTRTALGWNDGIPDQWRIQFFGSLINMLSHADADADGDGMSNRAEFKAGTNPMERLSKFLLGAERSNVGKVALRLPSVAGKKYVFEGTTNISSGDWAVLDGDVTGTGEVMEITPPTSGGNYEFFRVRIVE